MLHTCRIQKDVYHRPGTNELAKAGELCDALGSSRRVGLQKVTLGI
jgi:hypothetical protein